MPIGDTDLLATKNDLITSQVQRQLISKAVTMPTISDKSAWAGKGSKSIEFPRGGDFTVQSRATTAEATLDNVTYATDSITFLRPRTVAYLVDDADELQSTVGVQSDLAIRAGKGLAKDFDTLVIAGIEAAAAATTTVGAITKDIVLEMRESLLSAEADMGALTLLVGPDSERTLLSIAEFVEPDRYGSARIPSGVLGTLYGVNVVMSTQIAATTYYMYEKEGYGFAKQRDVMMGEAAKPRFGTQSREVVFDHIFGHASLQNSALLVKDNN